MAYDRGQRFKCPLPESFSFIKKHEKFFRSNPRLSLMVNIYEKKPVEMKKNYEKICEEFIASLYD